MLKINNLNIVPVQVRQLEIYAGITALKAPSGSGKSRILKAIADLVLHTGEVSLNGKNRSEMPAPEWRKMVRYISAEPAFWGKTVLDNMSDNATTRKLATQFGLADKLFNSPIDQLSTGEKQRFGLVRALADNPQILLLDEPTAALDEKTTIWVEAELQKRADSGVVIVLISHNDAQIKRIATKTYTIIDGELVEAQT